MSSQSSQSARALTSPKTSNINDPDDQKDQPHNDRNSNTYLSAPNDKISAAKQKLFDLQLKFNQIRSMNQSEANNEVNAIHNPKLRSKPPKPIQSTTDSCNQLDQDNERRDPNIQLLHSSSSASNTIHQLILDKQNRVKANTNFNPNDPEKQLRSFEKQLDKLPILNTSNDDVQYHEGSNNQSALNYGQSNHTEADVDRLVSEMHAAAERKNKWSRRRRFNEDEDVSYINERNRVFNKKIKRAYDSFTAEIAQNFERGTAI